MNDLRINAVRLVNIGPYENTLVEFKPGLNLICGGNGIGKTTVLEAVASPFGVFGAHTRLKRRALAEDAGRVVLNIFADGQNRETDEFVQNFDPVSNDQLSGFQNFARYLINIRTDRSFVYNKRNTIDADPVLDNYQIGNRVIGGLQALDIKPWFVNRYLLQHHAEEGGWTPSMKKNLELAKSWFSILDETVTLSGVHVKTFDIQVKTPSGKIPFEYLSAGFRSIYSLFLGILKEIEFRSLDVSADEFSGTILIDEIDLHLHPSWQTRVAGALQKAFPAAQIIATTHSPHVIQAAGVSEVIALAREPGKDVHVRDIPPNEFGFAGWSIEEILEDVMGMKTVRSPLYEEAERLFDKAIDAEDGKQAQIQLGRLQKMLHPSSHIKTLLELRAAPIIGVN